MKHGGSLGLQVLKTLICVVGGLLIKSHPSRCHSVRTHSMQCLPLQKPGKLKLLELARRARNVHIQGFLDL